MQSTPDAASYGGTGVHLAVREVLVSRKTTARCSVSGRLELSLQIEMFKVCMR